MKEKIRKVIFLVCVLLCTGCCIFVAAWFIRGQIQRNENKELEDIFYSRGTEILSKDPEGVEEVAEVRSDKAKEMAALAELNEDLAGWITVEGTGIDYPVVQAADNEYYLTRDFYQNSNSHGAIFQDAGCTGEGLENLIIYGHHMKDGTMFHDLSYYKNQDFCEAHPIITLYDRQGQRKEYRIISAFLWDGTDENSFPFYKYKQLTVETYADYVEGVQSHALYSEAVNVQEPAQLISLTTCDYVTADARLIVVGMRMVE